jgi:hypothetical protein
MCAINKGLSSNRNIRENYQLNDSSTKSMVFVSSLRLTELRTASLMEPPPQTVTAVAPIRPSSSVSRSVSKFGRPGINCTLDEVLTASTEVFGLVTKSRIFRMSRLLGIARITSIHGRIHSSCSNKQLVYCHLMSKKNGALYLSLSQSKSGQSFWSRFDPRCNLQ